MPQHPLLRAILRRARKRATIPSTCACVQLTCTHVQGICCSLPPVTVRPLCPVGVAHESSAANGCTLCPAFGYFCHRDARVSAAEVSAGGRAAHVRVSQSCCPTPCINPSDVYISQTGQCLPVASFGEACETSAQCVGTRQTFMPTSSARALHNQQLLHVT
jgi:hypothetical protein